MCGHEMCTIDIWNQHAARVRDIKRKTKAVELLSEILIGFLNGEKHPSIIINFIVPVLESWHSLCYLLFEYEYGSTNFREFVIYDSK